MPKYGYNCPTCGPIQSDVRADSIYCSGCSEIRNEVLYAQEARRDFGFHLDFSFQPYYAPSFGTVVNSRQHAKDLAKIAGEEYTLRTGTETNYQVVDTHDDAAVGVDTEHKKEIHAETRRHAVNGAAWSRERFKEVKKQRDELRASKRASADA